MINDFVTILGLVILFSFGLIYYRSTRTKGNTSR